MSDIDDAVNAIMEKALAELGALFAQEAEQSAAVCVNWVLVCDWSTVGDTEGARWISRWFNPRWPTWYRNALLDHARGDWPNAQTGPGT